MSKKLTLKLLDTYIKANLPSDTMVKTIMVDGQLYDINIKTCLSIQQMTGFVDYVADGCFTLDGDYAPEYFDVMFQSAIMQLMTDLPLPYRVVNNSEEKTVDYIRAYNLMKSLEIETFMREDPTASKTLDQLVENIQDKINFKKEQIIKKSIVSEKIIHLIDSITEFVNQFEGSIDFESLQKNISKLAKTTKLDERKIVDAVIENKKSDVNPNESNDNVLYLK